MEWFLEYGNMYLCPRKIKDLLCRNLLRQRQTLADTDVEIKILEIQLTWNKKSNTDLKINFF